MVLPGILPGNVRGPRHSLPLPGHCSGGHWGRQADRKIKRVLSCWPKIFSPEILRGHARNGLLIGLLVPHQRLGGQVALGRLFHLFLGTGDVLVLQINLVPIVLVPPDEEEDIGPAEQVLLVQFTQHTTCGDHVEEAYYDPGILSSQVSNSVRGIGEERLPCHDLNPGLLATVLEVLHGL